MQKTSVISFRLGNLHLWKFDSNPVIKNTQLNAIYLYLYLKKELKKKKLYVLDYQIQLNTNNELTLFKFIYFRYKQKYQKKLKWWQRKEIAEKKWKMRREKRLKEKKIKWDKRKQKFEDYKNWVLFKKAPPKKKTFKIEIIKKINKKRKKNKIYVKWKKKFKRLRLNIPLINYYYKGKLTKKKWQYLKKKILLWLKKWSKNSISINFFKKNLKKITRTKNIKKQTLLHFIFIPKIFFKNKLLQKSLNVLRSKILKKLKISFKKSNKINKKNYKTKKYLKQFKNILKIKNQKFIKNKHFFFKWIKKNKIKNALLNFGNTDKKLSFNYTNKKAKKFKTIYYKWLNKQLNNITKKRKLIKIIFKQLTNQTNKNTLKSIKKNKQTKNIKFVMQRYIKTTVYQKNNKHKKLANLKKKNETYHQKKLKIQLRKTLYRIRFQFKLEQKIQKRFNHSIRIKSQNIKKIMPKAWKTELKGLKTIAQRYFWKIKYAKELLLLTFMSFMFQKTDALSIFISKNFRRQRFPKNYLTTLIRIFDKLKNRPWFGAFKISVWGKLTRSKKQRSVELKQSWGRIDATTLNTPVFETLTHLRHKKGIYGMKLKIKSNYAFKKTTQIPTFSKKKNNSKRTDFRKNKPQIW